MKAQIGLPLPPDHLDGHAGKSADSLQFPSSISSWRDQRCFEWFDAPWISESFRIMLMNRPDVRNIISDDEALQTGVKPVLREYNLEQFITVEVPGTGHQV